MSIENNIIKMYYLKAIQWFMVAMPIIVLFFQDHDLSLTQVMILQAIYSTVIVLFEIPSGFIADVFERKNIIFLSTIFSFFGYLIFSFFSGFYYFAIAQILVGIGGSLISGSDSSLIYDTLLELKKNETYTKIEGKNYAIGNFSESIAAILGGYLALTSLSLPIYIQTTVLFFSIPISLTLVEPCTNKKNRVEKSIKSMIDIMKFAIFKNKKIRYLIIYSSIMGFATLSMAWFVQPFLIEIHFYLGYYGILWAIFNFTAGITSYNAYKIYDKMKSYNLLIFISLIMSLSFIMLGLNITYLGLVFIFLIYLIRGIVTPILRNEININIESNKRATVLSIRSMFIRLTFAILAPILAYISEINFSLTITFIIIGIIVGTVSFFSLYQLKKID